MTAPGGRSTGAWAVLALALAVPGLLFYTWWSKMDAAKKKELNQKIRNRGVSAFATTGRNKEKLENPIAAGQAAASGSEPSQPPSGNALEAGVAAAPVTAPADPAAPEPAPMPGLAEPGPAASGTSPSSQLAGDASQPPSGDALAPGIPMGEAAASSMTAQYFLIAAGMPKRDPTVSPYDEIRLQRRALEDALRRKELEDALKPAKERKVVKRAEPMPKIELQGIISTPEGDFRAIVNDNLQREGDMIAGGKVKILKISPSTVVFVWKTKRFTLSVNQ